MNNIVGNTEWNGLPMPRRLRAIVAVAFGVSVSVLDSVSQCRPADAGCRVRDIVRQLGVDRNAYQLALITTLLIFSNLGDIVGYRRIYIFGLLLFTAASAGCALLRRVSPRLSCGAPCRVWVPQPSRASIRHLIRVIYPRRMLGRGMSINATVVAVSSVAGPSVAAAILSVTSWHWLFAVNLPVGAVAFVLSRRFLPQNPVRVEGRRFDWRSGVMCALTFGLVMSCVEGYSHGMSLQAWLPMAAVAAFVAWRFVTDQLRRQMPILPFDLLRIPIFSLSIVTSICSFTAQMLAMVALPFILQHSMGYDAVSTGLIFTAWPMVIMVVAPVAGVLSEHIHAGYLGLGGLLVMTFGLVMLGLLPASPSDFDIIWRLVVCGMGFGLFQSPNNSIMIASAPQHRSGSASGMLASARLVGQTLGGGACGFFFHWHDGETTMTPLFVAAAFSLFGAVLSASRIHLHSARGPEA